MGRRGREGNDEEQASMPLSRLHFYDSSVCHEDPAHEREIVIDILAPSFKENGWEQEEEKVQGGAAGPCTCRRAFRCAGPGHGGWPSAHLCAYFKNHLVDTGVTGPSLIHNLRVDYFNIVYGCK